MKIKIDEAKTLSKRVLKKIGYDESESEIISDSLIWAQERGSSQGLGKLFGWHAEKRIGALYPAIEKAEGGLVLINANENSHIVACELAVNEVISKKGDTHICVAGVKNTYNSAGALGYYTEKLAKRGLISIMMSAADPGVSVFGGNKPVLGTNPISIAVPSDGDPVLLDMSTAALTWGDLIKYDQDSKPLPQGLAFDIEGKPTTDPKKAMDGWVSTFDKSYKGSGISLMIQILAGPLIGSVYINDNDNCQYGSLIITINPKSFGDEKLFIERVTSMIKDFKSSGPAPGFAEVLIPGESGYRRSLESIQSGMVEVSEDLYKKILEFIN